MNLNTAGGREYSPFTITYSMLSGSRNKASAYSQPDMSIGKKGHLAHRPCRQNKGRSSSKTGLQPGLKREEGRASSARDDKQIGLHTEIPFSCPTWKGKAETGPRYTKGHEKRGASQLRCRFSRLLSVSNLPETTTRLQRSLLYHLLSKMGKDRAGRLKGTKGTLYPEHSRFTRSMVENNT